MKTLGLVGGTTWASTLDYYRILNEETNRRLGEAHASRLIMYSFNFQELLNLVRKDDNKTIRKMVLDICRSLIDAGAEGILLCANTLHQYADFIQGQIDVPIIHITKATADTIRKAQVNPVALLGTRVTMEKDFYKGILAEYKVQTRIPGQEDRDYIQQKIYDEFSRDIFTSEAKARLISIVNGMIKEGCKGVILGCTELPLIIGQDDFDVPVFDTLKIHCMAAVEFALGK